MSNTNHACPECGAPGREHRKWNGGNPVDIVFYDCECSEREAEAWADRYAERTRRAAGDTGGAPKPRNER